MVCRGLACDECTQNCQKHHQKGDSSPTIPGCLKFIFGRDFSKFLYLPLHFAQKVKHLNGKSTHIKDSNGKIWTVVLSYVDDKLAFREGWHSFYQDHGLHDGHILAIQYMKGSHFVVQIYNRCGCEKTKFNKGRPKKNKRSKGGPEKVSKDELVQTPMEDICMINRDNGCLQEENRNVLDLEKFGRVKEATDADKSVKASDAKIAPDAEIMDNANEFEEALDTNINPCCTETTEQTEITGHDSQMAVISENQINGDSGDVFTDEFEKALETNVVPSHADTNEQSKIAMTDKTQMTGNLGEILTDEFGKVLETNVVPSHADINEQSKIKGDDSKIAMVDTNQINGNSGKSCEAKAIPSHTESKEQNKTMVDDAQMIVNQITAHYRDTFTDKFHFEPSDNCNWTKRISNAVSKLQNDSESPSIGSSKISGRESAVKRRFCESSFSSSVLKDPFGKRCIKRERVELAEEVKVVIGLSRDAGKEPTMVKKRAKISPIVKVEPDLSFDDDFSLFSADVKTQSYLELPRQIPSIPGRKERGQGKVVYLRDSIGRLWPVLCPHKYSVKAFTANWTNFCKQNNVKPGDRCRFHFEPNMMCTYRVDVTRRFAADK